MAEELTGLSDFHVEVLGKAHELSHEMGFLIARSHAARLAAEALAEGANEEYEFWYAVERALTPR